MHGNTWQFCLLTLLATSVGVATAADGQRAPTPWTEPGRVAIGLTVSTTGGPGAAVDVGLLARVDLRARWLGVWGTVARGAGVGVDIVQAEELRGSAMVLAGEVRCVGDPDSAACPNSPGSSFAWHAGGGVEFALSSRSRWTFGIEIGRWFTETGPTLEAGEQRSRTFVTGLIRRYLGPR